MNSVLAPFRDALRDAARREGVSFVDYSNCRCWAEPFAWGPGPNLSAEGAAEMDDDSEGRPDLVTWSMYSDVVFEGHTIGLLVMTANGYLAIEPSSAPPSCKNESRRAWLAHHRMELVEIDADLLKADPYRVAREFFETAHEFDARKRRRA
jgi:hypothetical protein